MDKRKWKTYEQLTELSFEVSNITSAFLRHKISLFCKFLGIQEDALEVSVAGVLRDKNKDHLFSEDWFKVLGIKEDNYVLLNTEKLCLYELSGIDLVKFSFLG